nr:hypothetical protein [Tanacetum cinerariifolium]
MDIRAYEEDKRHEEWIQKIEEDKRREEWIQKIEEVINLIQSFIRNPISPVKTPQPVTTKKEKEKERAFRVDEIKVSVVIEVGQTKAIDGGLNYDNRLANYEQPFQHFLMFDYDPQEGELQVKPWDPEIRLGKIMEQHLEDKMSNHHNMENFESVLWVRGCYCGGRGVWWWWVSVLMGITIMDELVGEGEWCSGGVGGGVEFICFMKLRGLLVVGFGVDGVTIMDELVGGGEWWCSGGVGGEVEFIGFMKPIVQWELRVLPCGFRDKGIWEVKGKQEWTLNFDSLTFLASLLDCFEKMPVDPAFAADFQSCVDIVWFLTDF